LRPVTSQFFPVGAAISGIVTGNPIIRPNK
jgi:hypothetical protein